MVRPKGFGSPIFATGIARVVVSASDVVEVVPVVVAALEELSDDSAEKKL